MNNPNPILYERKEESNHEADPLVLEVFGKFLTDKVLHKKSILMFVSLC